MHLFYNLQLFYWHFLEILWLFIFLVFYNYFIYSQPESLKEENKREEKILINFQFLCFLSFLSYGNPYLFYLLHFLVDPRIVKAQRIMKPPRKRNMDLRVNMDLKVEVLFTVDFINIKTLSHTSSGFNGSRMLGWQVRNVTSSRK